MDTCTCVGMHMHACNMHGLILVVPFGRVPFGRTTLWSYYPLVVLPFGRTGASTGYDRYLESGSLGTGGVRTCSAVGLRAWFPESGPRRDRDRRSGSRGRAYGIRFAVARASASGAVQTRVCTYDTRLALAFRNILYK